MTKILILKSITHGMQGQKILQANRVSCRLERNLTAIQKYGCGYGLRVKSEDVGRASQMLAARGIVITEIMD